MSAPVFFVSRCDAQSMVARRATNVDAFERIYALVDYMIHIELKKPRVDFELETKLFTWGVGRCFKLVQVLLSTGGSSQRRSTCDAHKPKSCL